MIKLKIMTSKCIDQMTVVYLNASSFANDQLRSHCEIISSFVLLCKVEVGMSTSLDPHMEFCIVPPSFSHDFTSSQVLLCFSFVNVEHEEKHLFRHLWND